MKVGSNFYFNLKKKQKYVESFMNNSELYRTCGITLHFSSYLKQFRSEKHLLLAGEKQIRGIENKCNTNVHENHLNPREQRNV